MANNTVLVIPHVGSAYGHLIRTGELLSKRYLEYEHVFLCVPSGALSFAKSHMPSHIKYWTYDIRPTVTSKSGDLDNEGFLALLKLDKNAYDRIRPSLIVGDPGIRAGLLGEYTGTRWEALMHGCYLPLPCSFKNAPYINMSLGRLATMAWSLVTRELDKLVRLGSNNAIPNWDDLRQRGTVLIPNSMEAEPNFVGTHLGDEFNRIGFSSGSEYPCVVTLCSSGESDVPQEVVQYLVNRYKKIAIIGSLNRDHDIRNVHFLGSSVATESLVGPNTTVITHGGHGTLKAVRQAKRIIALPGDIDQLCNTLVALVCFNLELASETRWLERLTSPHPFRRIMDWAGLIDYLQK